MPKTSAIPVGYHLLCTLALYSVNLTLHYLGYSIGWRWFRYNGAHISSRSINNLPPWECAMFITRSLIAPAVFFFTLSVLQACTDEQKTIARATPVEESTMADADSAEPTEDIAPATAKDAEEIDPESLELAGEVETEC